MCNFLIQVCILYCIYCCIKLEFLDLICNKKLYLVYSFCVFFSVMVVWCLFMMYLCHVFLRLVVSW